MHKIWRTVHWSSLWWVRQSLWQSWEGKQKECHRLLSMMITRVCSPQSKRTLASSHAPRLINTTVRRSCTPTPSGLICLHCCEQWPSICLLTPWKVRTMKSPQRQQILARDQETSYLSLKLLFAHFLDLWVACDRVDGMMDSIIFENSLQHYYYSFR